MVLNRYYLSVTVNQRGRVIILQLKTVKSRVPWRAAPAARVCGFLSPGGSSGRGALLCFPSAAGLRKQAGFQEFKPAVHSEEGGRCPAGPSPALRRQTPSPSSPLLAPTRGGRRDGLRSQ